MRFELSLWPLNYVKISSMWLGVKLMCVAVDRATER